MNTPDKIKEISRKLRINMTESEVILWSCLRGGKIGAKFLRQKPLRVFTEDSGLERYIIPDFYCYEKKLILEIDGSIHNRKEVFELDSYKEKLLHTMGFKVIRIKNDDIKSNLTQTINTIKKSM